MLHVLVTGGFGFLGRHVSRHYGRQGAHVIGLGHGAWGRAEWEEWGITRWHSCDITVETLLTYAGEPDVIIHCAGSGEVGFSMNHPYQDYERSVATTLSVLEFTRLHAPTARIVLPSSAGVYGETNELPITELSPLKPTSPYGVHKKIAEDLCLSYAHHFSTKVSIIRFFSIYGTGLRKQLLWDACGKLKKGEFSFWGTGGETRDWLNVEDATNLLDKAGRYATSDAPIVNGASGAGVSVFEILKEVFGGFGITHAPEFIGSTKPGDPMHYVADITNALAWDWKPEKTWQEGVREYVEWYKRVIR